MNRRFTRSLTVWASLALLAPFAVRDMNRPVLAQKTQSVGAVVMNAGMKVTGTVSYGTRTFRPSDRTLVCIVVFAKPAPGARVKTEWYAVDAGGMKNTKFNESEFTYDAVDNSHLFGFTMQNPWPVGKYQVKVFKDGKYDRSIAFNVK